MSIYIPQGDDKAIQGQKDRMREILSDLRLISDCGDSHVMRCLQEAGEDQAVLDHDTRRVVEPYDLLDEHGYPRDPLTAYVLRLAIRGEHPDFYLAEIHDIKIE